MGPVVGGIILTALPEALRGLANTGVPLWLGQFLKDGRLIIFGLLIVVGTIFYPKGIITPEFLDWVKHKIQKLFSKQKQGT